ncbi:hypothetical protein pb186bvf_004933 [Paramecium bursaria]
MKRQSRIIHTSLYDEFTDLMDDNKIAPKKVKIVNDAQKAREQGISDIKTIQDQIPQLRFVHKEVLLKQVQKMEDCKSEESVEIIGYKYPSWNCEVCQKIIFTEKGLKIHMTRKHQQNT